MESLFSLHSSTNLDKGAPKAHTISTMMLMAFEALIEQTISFCDFNKLDLQPASEIYKTNPDQNKVLEKMLDIYRLVYRQDCERSIKI